MNPFHPGGDAKPQHATAILRDRQRIFLSIFDHMVNKPVPPTGSNVVATRCPSGWTSENGDKMLMHLARRRTTHTW
jgi:hypothetical protein